MADYQDAISIGGRVVKDEKVLTKGYTLNVDAFVYAGEIYINSQQFDEEFRQFQMQRTMDGSYLNDFESIDDYYYSDEAVRLYLRWQEEYPECNISYESVYAMLKAETERQKVYSSKKTVSECIQDAAQVLLDVGAVAMACTGHPWVSIVLQGGNVAIAGGRENYDEMTNRLIFLCIDGAIEISDSLNSIKILDKKVADDAIHAIGVDDVADVVQANGEVKVTLQDGTELIFKESQLEADDIIRLQQATKERVAVGSTSVLDDVSVQVEKQIKSGKVTEVVTENDITIIKCEDGTSIEVKPGELNENVQKELEEVVNKLNPEEIVSKGAGKSNPNITQKISKGGNTITDYTNPSGNKIRTTAQTPSTINQSINKKAAEVNPKKIGDFYEGKVAKYIQENTSEEVTAFGQEVKNMTTKQLAGDIDVETNNYIVEVKKSTSAIDMKQLKKYTDPNNENYLNYNNKQIVYYIDEEINMDAPGVAEKINEIKQSGAIVVNSLEELGEVMK